VGEYGKSAHVTERNDTSATITKSNKMSQVVCATARVPNKYWELQHSENQRNTPHSVHNVSRTHSRYWFQQLQRNKNRHTHTHMKRSRRKTYSLIN